MRSDFINKREIYRRRQGGTNPPQTKDCNLIVLPTFDTFIFHNPITTGSDRWDEFSQGTPNTSTSLIVGLLNPLNDADEQPQDGPFGSPVAPRTPTRTILAYGLTGLPANASIVSATLNLTVSATNAWDGQEDSSLVNPQNGIPTILYNERTDEIEDVLSTSTTQGNNSTQLGDGITDELIGFRSTDIAQEEEIDDSIVIIDEITITSDEDGIKWYWPPCYSPADYPLFGVGGTDWRKLISERFNWRTPFPTLTIPCPEQVPGPDDCPTYVHPFCFDGKGRYDNGLRVGGSLDCKCLEMFVGDDGIYWIRCGDELWFLGEWGGELTGKRWIPYVPGLGVPAGDNNSDYPNESPSRMFPGEIFEDDALNCCGIHFDGILELRYSSQFPDGQYLPWTPGSQKPPVYKRFDRFNDDGSVRYKPLYWKRVDCDEYRGIHPLPINPGNDLIPPTGV